jgi:hypothetical protein
MSDYFGRVQQELGNVVASRSHLPWYLRVRPRRSRPAIVALAGLLATGSALAASGVLRTGAPVGAPVAAIPGAYEGAVIPGSTHMLALRVADPDGGPPWGLRVLRTTRGLTCVQFGRVVDGRLGVLGRDGAFDDDGAFHPFASDFLDGVGCGTDDARGNAFINEQFHGVPASALVVDQQHISGGCYRASTGTGSCPKAELRDVYFGLLGPDALSITRTAAGGDGTIPTVGPEGAYLIVLAHRPTICMPKAVFCTVGESFSTGGPELVPYEVIRAVNYRGGRRCQVLTAAQLRPGHMSSSCPAVGYSAPAAHPIAAAQLASKVSAHVEPARFYCEKDEQIAPCEGRVPRGARRIDTSIGPPELLLVVEFTARAAVTNFDSHYEIDTSDPSDPRDRSCPVAGASQFGPTQRNLRAGQRVRYTEFVDRGCPGETRVSVGYVTVDGPSGDEPVPGLPGQSGEIPVGHTTFEIP